MRRVVLAAAIGLALAGSAAAQDAPPRPFDLVCQGEGKRSLAADPAPETRHYRLDPAAGLWCEGDCRASHAFVAVTPDAYVLEDLWPRAPLWARIEHTISRTAGTAQLAARGQDGYWRSFLGSCAPQPFSGLPTARF